MIRKTNFYFSFSSFMYCWLFCRAWEWRWSWAMVFVGTGDGRASVGEENACWKTIELLGIIWDSEGVGGKSGVVSPSYWVSIGNMTTLAATLTRQGLPTKYHFTHLPTWQKQQMANMELFLTFWASTSPKQQTDHYLYMNEIGV